MGNLTSKFAGHSKHKSQQCIETSKIPCLGIPIKKKVDLDLEKEKMTARKKNVKIGSNPENENLDLENGKTTARRTNGDICSNPVTLSSIFPPEIIIEILSRVPVKYLPKIQLVCKHWCHVVQDRQFLEKQMSQAPNLTECNYKPKNAPDRETFKLVSACDGLVLRVSNTTCKYHIKNRTTKQVLELPDPHKHSFGITFSYVPSTLNYKLVSIHLDEAETSNELCQVLTIGSDSLWRAIEMPNLMDPGKKRERVSVVSTGVFVHCFRVFKVGLDIFEEILSLDLGTESFTITNVPKGLYRDTGNVWALDWYGKLGVADMVKGDLRVLVLEDYKKGLWAEREIIVPLVFTKEYEAVKADLVPVLVEVDSIWFWLKEKKMFSYNFKIGRIEKTVRERDGYTICNTLFRQPASLVKLEGMQPLKKTVTEPAN
ncbi:hypothetical protein LguiA_025316 [Lonicera macranthoides]